MFQLNPELLEIIQKYQDLLKNSQFKEKITMSKYAFAAFITIVVLYILICILDNKNPKIFKKITKTDNFLNKTENYFIIIAALPLAVAIISWCNSGSITIQIADSIIQEYNLKHESGNPLKNFDKEWLTGLIINPEIENTTVFETKHACTCHGNPPSVKYMQIEPAPEGDAPVVETKIITKNEITTHNSNHIQPSDIKLIKIEKKDDTTLITTHIKINNQWYKTQLQESLLDLILEGKTQQYYDNAQGKIIVGV